MHPGADWEEFCRHDRAPLKRLGRVCYGGKPTYLLLCTECGFTVSTDELRRLWGIEQVRSDTVAEGGASAGAG